jgi:hypothetical protein
MLYGLLCLVPFIAACGKSDLETFPVSGEVRFRGKPAAGAVIMFHRKVESDDRKILLPNGRTDQLGRFILGTYAQNDGAPAGEYRVSIIWPGPLPNAVPGDSESSHGGPDKLKGRYGDPEKSGLKATVAASNNNLPPFELK